MPALLSFQGRLRPLPYALAALAVLLAQYAAIFAAFAYVGRPVTVDWLFVLVPLRAAYGASVPVKVVSKIPQSPNLYVKKLYLVVDKNPSKQGKFLPGTRIPIVSEDYIRRERPDYVVVLPWNLREEVVADLAYVREWGGRFVTAIPQLRET